MAAGGRADSTVALRVSHVLRLSRHVGRGPGEVTADMLDAYVGGRGWAPATMQSVRASLTLFFRWAHTTGRVDVDPAVELPTVLMPRALPRPATEAAARAAVTAVDDRTALMAALMAQCGLRRAEVATVRGGDVLDGVDGHRLRVTGKGGHVRVVPLPPDVAAAIRRRGPGWTFPGQIDGHLSPRRVGELVAAALPAGVTAHALRHRFASVVYERTHDIRAVQELLGHARLDTTMVYVRVGDEARDRAAAAAWRVAA